MISHLPHLRNPTLQDAHKQYRDKFVTHADFQRLLGHELPGLDQPEYKAAGLPHPDPVSGHFHAADVIKYLRTKCAAAPPVDPQDAAKLKAARSGRLGIKW